MISRRIFKKRKSNKKIIFLFLCTFFLIIFIYFYIVNKNKIFILIPENQVNFYTIPEDRGGVKVPNLDKKSLNLQSKQIIENHLYKPEDFLFSIQFYVDDDLEKVNDFLKKITNSDETIYNFNDFYILTLNSDIGIEYYLIYKNFKKREDAINYCLKFLSKIDSCLIVDTTKF